MRPAVHASQVGSRVTRSRRGALSHLIFARHGDGTLRLRWRIITGALLTLLVLTYVSLAAARYVIVRFQRGVPGAQFVDALFPHRWSNLRVAQGNHAVATGISLARAGKRREALAFLTAGLRAAPANHGGRILLAQILAAGKRPDPARALLLEGLEFHREHPAYVTTVFRFLLEHQEDQTAVSVARKLLASSKLGESRRIAALAGATASFHRGNYDQADDFLDDTPQLKSSAEGQLLLAKCDWERGYRELALMRLRGLADQRRSDSAVHHELVIRLRQLGKNDDARRRTLAFQIAQPGLAGPRVELLRAYHDAGEHGRAEREASALVRDFAADAPALLALADFAATTGNVSLAQALFDHAQARGLPSEPHAFLHLEALLTAGRHAEALQKIREFQNRPADRLAAHPALLDSLEAVAYLGTGERDNARLSLSNFLHQSTLRADNLLALAKRFVDLDAADEACRILERAIEIDRFNQAAVSRLVELDLILNRVDELPAHLALLVGMRKPSPDILRVAQHKLGSDLFLFSPARSDALAAVRATLEQSTTAAAPLR